MMSDALHPIAREPNLIGAGKWPDNLALSMVAALTPSKSANCLRRSINGRGFSDIGLLFFKLIECLIIIMAVFVYLASHLLL
jgi:hypothetical protein